MLIGSAKRSSGSVISLRLDQFWGQVSSRDSTPIFSQPLAKVRFFLVDHCEDKLGRLKLKPLLWIPRTKHRPAMNSSSDSFVALVAQLRQGDPYAAEDVYREYARRLIGLANR